jgi:Mce-associated membrane protein
MTPVPGPDEKVCPFCAEVIRAAAVKCRYCHSDLPVDQDAPPLAYAPDPTEPEPPATSEAPMPITAPAPNAAPTLTTPLIAMLSVSLVLALGIALIVISARADDLRTAGNGQVTSVPYRDAAMSAAAANASTVLSYGYKTLDADEKAARAVLTAAFAKKYGTVMDTAGPKATSAKLTLKATVEATSLISLKKDSAKLLLFVNTVTTKVGSQNQQLNQNRVLMEMTRQDGDWVVSKLTPF